MILLIELLAIVLLIGILIGAALTKLRYDKAGLICTEEFTEKERKEIERAIVGSINKPTEGTNKPLRKTSKKKSVRRK